MELAAGDRGGAKTKQGQHHTPTRASEAGARRRPGDRDWLAKIYRARRMAEERGAGMRTEMRRLRLATKTPPFFS